VMLRAAAGTVPGRSSSRRSSLYPTVTSSTSG
jgi:hypothetical protein